MKKTVLTLLVFLLLTGGALAQEVVRVGVMGVISDGPFFIGEEKGYFKQQGIKVELHNFISATKMMAPISAGQLEVAGGAVSAGLFNGVARGFPIKVVVTRSYDAPGHAAITFMIRSDLKDKVAKISDFKGRKVAINAAGSISHYVLLRLLEAGGLKKDDVETVFLRFPDMVPALKNKAVDIVLSVEPFTTLIGERDYGFQWKNSRDVIADLRMQAAVLFFNKDWAGKNKRTADKFMVAYLKSVRDYYHAMEGGSDRAKIVDILSRKTRIKNKRLYDKMKWLFIDPNGWIIEASLRDTQEVFSRNGLVKQKVDPASVIDYSHLRSALKVLGEIPCSKCAPK